VSLILGGNKYRCTYLEEAVLAVRAYSISEDLAGPVGRLADHSLEAPAELPHNGDNCVNGDATWMTPIVTRSLS